MPSIPPKTETILNGLLNAICSTIAANTFYHLMPWRKIEKATRQSGATSTRIAAAVQNEFEIHLDGSRAVMWGVIPLSFHRSKLVAQPISITAFSTALFSTWVFVEQFALLFDCGDGVTSTLLQKSRKVRHAFISHADRDHLTGLLQFNQLNGRPELSIHYPKDCGSFRAIADFTAKFDPHIRGTSWNPISNGDTTVVKNNLQVVAMANRHIPNAQPLTKSLSFVVQQSKKKLKPKFTDLMGQEIAKLRQTLSDDELFDKTKDVELIYSGDTPVETDGRYSNTRILIHESTFLDREELKSGRVDRNHHSSLDAVMEMVADSNIENLILGHFSSRYSDAQIDESVARQKQRCDINIPVFVIYPGRISQFEI